MRLHRYLNEIGTPVTDEMGNTLKNECSEYISVLEKLGGKMNILKSMLYRGARRGPDGIEKRTPRKHRKPLDTPFVIQEELDGLFKEEFGGEVRSRGVFATSKVQFAGDYGVPHLFFPADGFKFVGSEHIQDLFGEIKDRNIADETGPNPDMESEEIKEQLEGIVDLYTDSNLVDAMKSGHEITFLCKYYYLVNNSSKPNIVGKILGEE